MTTEFIRDDIALQISERRVVIIHRVSEDGKHVYTNNGESIEAADIAHIKRPGYLRELCNEIAHMRRELHDATSESVTIADSDYMCSPALYKALEAAFRDISRMRSHVRNYQHREKNMQRDIDDSRASLGVVLEKLGRIRGHIAAASSQARAGNTAAVTTILKEVEKI